MVLNFFQRLEMVLTIGSELFIYDYDTTLPFPCEADEYVMETFKPEVNLRQQFDR